MRRKLYSLASAVFLVLVAGRAGASEVRSAFPRAAAAYLMKLQAGTLWSHNADRPAAPASLTKLMTALLVLQRARLDAVVIVGKAAAGEAGSRLGLRPGERLRVADLLAAMMLSSANDACRALADHVAGNQARFVTLMNREAGSLGMRDTRFANACGHDHPGLYSTARDLALLAEAVWRYPALREITPVVRTQVSSVDGERTFILENTNELVGRYPGAVGLKTGSTSKAGKCLIAIAEREGVAAMVVLLDAPDRWWTAAAMLDEAFAKAKTLNTVGQP